MEPEVGRHPSYPVAERFWDATFERMKEIGMEKDLEQLVKEIEAYEPLAATDEAYNRLVLSVARQYRGKGLSLDELVALAKTGLEKALLDYDSSRDFQFFVYAIKCMRQTILAAIE